MSQISPPQPRFEISADLYPTFSADPGRRAVLDTYLTAWQKRLEAPELLPSVQSGLLELHGQAYRAWLAGQDTAGQEERLRLLWDLCGVVHATMLPPEEIKTAIDWREPPVVDADDRPSVVLAEIRGSPVFLPFSRLPALVRQLIAETQPDSSEGQQGFGEFLAAHVRGVCLVPQLASWSPSCPLDVCGSSEPLTRTLILVPVGQVDLAPKAEWSLAAVAVHETAHLAWFHRPEVSRDPRLLLPVPNEREAWRQTAMFLRGLLRSASPALRPYVQVHGAGIRQMLQQARERVAQANRVLRLQDSDESLQFTIPTGVGPDDLRHLRH